MAGLTVILLARLAVLTGFLVVLAALLPGDSLAFYGMMALAYIVTIPYALWLKNKVRDARLLPLQFVVDLVVVTGLVYFTGGLQSDLALLYPLVILGAGIVAGPRQALQITSLCVVVYLTLVLLLWQGVLANHDGTEVSRPPWREAAGTVGVRLVVFALFGAASAYLSQRCTYVDRNLERFRELAEMVFRNLPAGLIMVDEQDRIRLVNDRAALMLDFQPRDLEGRALETVLQSGDPGVDDEWGDGSTARYLVRADRRQIPVHVDSTQLDWNPGVLNPSAEGGPRKIRILAISDISELLALQRSMKETVRARTIGAMASEIAHEIRNPIAAISGSVQLLDKLERRSVLGDTHSDRLLAAEKGMLYDCIVSEADRLGRVIEKFVDYSEFSVDTLRALIAMPEIHTKDETDVQTVAESSSRA
jgi:two-component system sensor histidine kinase PilS (NtrC family)